MPIYTWGCAACQREEEGFRHVDQRHDGPHCCGKQMTLVIKATMVQTDLPGYQSPVTGQWIEGRAARRDDLARTHSRPWEGREQEEKEAARQRAYEDAKDEVKLDAAARTAFSQLTPTQREEFRNSGPAD